MSVAQLTHEVLSLWADDGNALIDENELFSLEEMGANQIELEPEENARDEEGCATCFACRP